MRLEEMVLEWDERRRPAAMRWGSAPTPLTLGFVIMLAVAAPLAALVLPTGTEAGPVASPETPVLCVRSDSTLDAPDALADRSYAGAGAVLKCRTASEK